MINMSTMREEVQKSFLEVLSRLNPTRIWKGLILRENPRLVQANSYSELPNCRQPALSRSLQTLPGVDTWSN